MRQRMIKPEFFKSESLAECSHLARLAFIGLWCCANDFGNEKFSPRSLKSEIFGLDDITMEDFVSAIGELSECSSIRLYVVGENVYYNVPNFAVYQTVSHPSKTNIPEYSRGVPVQLHECSMSAPPKELVKELVNKAAAANADATAAPEDWRAAYVDSGVR